MIIFPKYRSWPRASAGELRPPLFAFELGRASHAMANARSKELMPLQASGPAALSSEDILWCCRCRTRHSERISSLLGESMIVAATADVLCDAPRGRFPGLARQNPDDAARAVSNLRRSQCSHQGSSARRVASASVTARMMLSGKRPCGCKEHLEDRNFSVAEIAHAPSHPPRGLARSLVTRSVS